MISFILYLSMFRLFVLLYICSLGFLSSAAFLFLRQVLGWKLGLSEECIGALSGSPLLDLDLASVRLVGFVIQFGISSLFRF